MTTAPRSRRADAERNRGAILEAALRCLAADPTASVGEIAAEAGLTRVALYGHFPSRTALVSAAFAHAMERSDQVLAGVELDDDPWQSLERLVLASWRIVGDSRLVLQAAEEELGAETVRAHHVEPMRRVRSLVRRGRREGAFRDDLPEGWLIACYYSVLHGAAEEVRAGRLAESRADPVVWETIASLFRRPD